MTLYYASVTAFGISIVSAFCIFILITYQKFLEKRQASLTLEQYIYGLTVHLKERFGKQRQWLCYRHTDERGD